MKSAVILIYLFAPILWARKSYGFHSPHLTSVQQSYFSSSSSEPPTGIATSATSEEFLFPLKSRRRQRRYNNADISCGLFRQRRYKSWPTSSSSSSAAETINGESINGDSKTEKASNGNLLGRFKEYITRLRFIWSGQMWALKKMVRYCIEKNTVYVLECKGGKYYVGSTSHKKQRYRQHLSERGGSKWTRTYKPIRILKQYKRVPSKYCLGLEAQVTAENMLELGINNVRGAMFAQCRDYTIDDLSALTGFLGHYNSLSYVDVEEKLKQILPPSYNAMVNNESSNKEDNDHENQQPNDNVENLSPSQKRRRRKKKKRHSKKDFDRCWKCGKLGHYASECPTLEE
mmetsp:Transcript_16485/g.23252  ORF Transcript_16485/g.23252 Transcript_16485/m.23252 type:complete len:345 (-) Transcript_16485:2295-3329(-)